MEADSKPPSTPGWMLWTGRILSALPVPLLLMSSLMKLQKSPEVLEGMPKLGWPSELAQALGVVELVCTILYIIPQTAVLGAILLTGYFGGAMATHIRIGEDWYFQFGFGVILWLGLFLRDARLRSLVPWRNLRS